MAVGRMTLLRRDDQWRDYVQYNVNKKQTMRNPLLAGIYTSVVLLDYYAQIWCKLLMHYRPNRVIIADRYVYDTVISDLAVHLDYSHARALRIIAYGLRIVPMPTRTILIDIPADVAFARKDDVPHVEYLEERRSYYLSLQRRPEVRLFSGEVSRETLVNAVLKEIREVKEGING
jgi:dTMP kinase